MEQAPVSHQPENISPQLPFEEAVWSHLTDRQKAQLLLNSTRMPDAETYFQDFTSWEQSEFINVQKGRHFIRSNLPF
ncbi:hypothetical protein A3860_18485 [Niastella vici]|uniref:Uncharacterized protein n=1 Tax=Niastella vici TaxID=1703345 RepID=A0A1V9G2E7_9BACT|nr:hypothetical protein [Niastella vici]OQP64747.1 hypothetical protein A3860_18485 [Niastella vici]